MTPFEDVVFDDRAVYLPTHDVLVLADLHVGRDATSEVELPMGEGTDLVSRFEALLDGHEPATVVVAGDLLHAFGTVPYGVPVTLQDLADLVADRAVELVVTTGNHDTILDALTEFTIVPEYRLDDGTVVHHGHAVPEASAERYLIGHEHPAIHIEGERHPCFLSCTDQYEGTDVLVLPAFNRFAVGTVVNSMSAADSMSPLVTDMDRCRPIVWSADESLHFPPLGELRSHL